MTTPNPLIEPDATDPLVTLWAMWRQAQYADVPETLTGEHSDDYGSGQLQQTGAIEDQLMEKPATTLIGMFAQLSVMREWHDNGGDVAGGQ